DGVDRLFRRARAPGVRDLGDVFESLDDTLAAVRRLGESDDGEGSQVVACVAPYGLLKANLPAGSRYVTFLRDPVDRTVSDYYFLITSGSGRPQQTPTREGSRILPPPTPEISLEEMLE